jgi:proteasome lid subunit RPN8/RPN11
MTHRVSVVMSADVHADLLAHLARRDRREDVCLATYRPSTGVTRRTAIVSEVVTPVPGERAVHGNASITGAYVVRAAAVARDRDEGLVLCHSHPDGRGWQTLSSTDRDAERSFANLARETTGVPLVGMTLAGRDGSWSARHWDRGAGGDVASTDAENVRVVGAQLAVSWNDAVVPRPDVHATQRRSISCWGQTMHDDLVRRSVLIVGTGSVGLEVALHLAATGVTRIGLMDFDTVEESNLDRLIGVTATDVWLRRAKVDVARRLVLENATASELHLKTWDHSICEPAGARHALDFDLIICCVDRPWPRAVLNVLAYTDLVPVIDGGIAVDTFPAPKAPARVSRDAKFPDGDGMRNATWRSHVIRPGRPCMVCNGQLDLGMLATDIEGLLDDPDYVPRPGPTHHAADGSIQAGTGQNVAVLSISGAAALLAQYVSFNVGPGGIGEPGPLQYVLSTNTLEHLPMASAPHCLYEAAEALGDARPVLSGRHAKAEERRDERAALPLSPRIGRIVDDFVWWWRRRLSAVASRRLKSSRRKRLESRRVPAWTTGPLRHRRGLDRSRRPGRGQRSGRRWAAVADNSSEMDAAHQLRQRSCGQPYSPTSVW